MFISAMVLITFSWTKKKCIHENLELIVVPVTIYNSGGQVGLITEVALRVGPTDKSARARLFKAVAIGIWRQGKGDCISQDSISNFSPIAIRSGEAVRESLIFYPYGGQKRAFGVGSGIYEFAFSAKGFRGSRFFGIGNEEVALPVDTVYREVPAEGGRRIGFPIGLVATKGHLEK